MTGLPLAQPRRRLSPVRPSAPVHPSPGLGASHCAPCQLDTSA
jgi:hypothetical protein